MRPDELYRSPNRLAPSYAAFRVADRLLLTGHSHQAWPDCAREGQLRAWDDAALLVDEKWERAFAMADRVRRGFATLLDDAEGDYALAPSTHDLLLRFLSALPLRARPRLVTTDGEFHTVRRQLDRLGEEGDRRGQGGVRLRRRPWRSGWPRRWTTGRPPCSSRRCSSRTRIACPTSALLAQSCARHGAELLVDAYHALGVVPFSITAEGLGDAFVTGGGYKYCQLGEGNCFLRIPPGREFRPVVTGWFSEFSALAADRPDAVAYGTGPDRFAGSTYDPTSHYRAAAVLDFFEREGLTPAFLREVSQHQVGRLAERFDALGLDPAVVTRDRTTPLEQLGGFLALAAPRAAELSRALRVRGVLADTRRDTLRLGPAPYLSDIQLDAAVELLGEVAGDGEESLRPSTVSLACRLRNRRPDFIRRSRSRGPPITSPLPRVQIMTRYTSILARTALAAIALTGLRVGRPRAGWRASGSGSHQGRHGPERRRPAQLHLDPDEPGRLQGRGEVHHHLGLPVRGRRAEAAVHPDQRPAAGQEAARSGPELGEGFEGRGAQDLHGQREDARGPVRAAAEGPDPGRAGPGRRGDRAQPGERHARR